MPEREDWPLLRQTLIARAECGFQLARTADRLEIRRNTLLHRLTKIEELSGRGVREPRTEPALRPAWPAWPTDLLRHPQDRSLSPTRQ
ncbi:helix-turn-helix domain-containing protein [Streptomyces sp. NPDC020362]|uniref:helix-turn-helix domain-containing protein n=1 Tax=unclassified Streptomyces TaxID=2593676 RepID=UPI0033D1B72D